mmetsp:Transcript_32068/g.112744  ORF Transcript_32068/g.112744 Transcript_32068/m.112744 type:complete len:597 (+) Transcript_32068:2225-4015(+)
MSFSGRTASIFVVAGFLNSCTSSITTTPHSFGPSASDAILMKHECVAMTTSRPPNAAIFKMWSRSSAVWPLLSEATLQMHHFFNSFSQLVVSDAGTKTKEQGKPGSSLLTAVGSRHRLSAALRKRRALAVSLPRLPETRISAARKAIVCGVLPTPMSSARMPPAWDAYCLKNQRTPSRWYSHKYMDMDFGSSRTSPSSSMRSGPVKVSSTKKESVNAGYSASSSESLAPSDSTTAGGGLRRGGRGAATPSSSPSAAAGAFLRGARFGPAAASPSPGEADAAAFFGLAAVTLGLGSSTAMSPIIQSSSASETSNLRRSSRSTGAGGAARRGASSTKRRGASSASRGAFLRAGEARASLCSDRLTLRGALTGASKPSSSPPSSLATASSSTRRTTTALFTTARFFGGGLRGASSSSDDVSKPGNMGFLLGLACAGGADCGAPNRAEAPVSRPSDGRGGAGDGRLASAGRSRAARAGSSSDEDVAGASQLRRGCCGAGSIVLIFRSAAAYLAFNSAALAAAASRASRNGLGTGRDGARFSSLVRFASLTRFASFARAAISAMAAADVICGASSSLLSRKLCQAMVRKAAATVRSLNGAP